MFRALLRRGAQRKIAAAASTALAALALATLAPAARATGHDPRSTYFGCGVVADAAHPWHSFVPHGNHETGDHWIASRAGRFSTCRFTRQTLHRLLALGPRTYQGRDVAHLLGGVCEWQSQDRHERIVPFAWIICHLPAPGHPRVAATSSFLVDGDPNFVH